MPRPIKCPYADDILLIKETEIERLKRRIRDMEGNLASEKSARRCLAMMVNDNYAQEIPSARFGAIDPLCQTECSNCGAEHACVDELYVDELNYTIEENGVDFTINGYADADRCYATREAAEAALKEERDVYEAKDTR